MKRMVASVFKHGSQYFNKYKICRVLFMTGSGNNNLISSTCRTGTFQTSNASLSTRGSLPVAQPKNLTMIIEAEVIVELIVTKS